MTTRRRGSMRLTIGIVIAAFIVTTTAAPAHADTSASSANALTIALVGGGTATSGSTSASNDGSTETLSGTQLPAVSVLGVQTVMTAGVLAQISRGFNNGTSAACSGIGGVGATFVMNSAGVCTVTPAAGVVLTLGVIGLATIEFDADVAYAICSSSGGTTAPASAILTNARITSTILGVSTTLVNFPANPAPNTALSIPGVMNINLNVQTSSGVGQIGVTAVEIDSLSPNLASPDIGAADCSSALSPLDTVPPVVTVPSNQNVEATGPTGAVVTFTATANDAVDGSLPAVCAPSSGSTFAIGSTTVTCTATDAAMNVGSATFQVTVSDTTPPVVAVPPAPVNAASTDASGATVAYTAIAVDSVDGNRPVTCLPPSGSTFAPGTTTVTCTSGDVAGNLGTASFDVIVSPFVPATTTTAESTTTTSAATSTTATATTAAPTTSAVPTTATSPLTAPTVPTVGPGSLPSTGTSNGPAVLLAIGAVAVGGVMVGVRRPRRQRSRM